MLDSITKLQYRLLEMGYELKIINRLLEIKKNTNINVLVNMLSKRNDIYLHEFYAKEDDETEKCYICGEINSKHEKDTSYKLPYNMDFLNINRADLDDENIQNNILESSIIYESSLVEDSLYDHIINEEKIKNKPSFIQKEEQNSRSAFTINNIRDENLEIFGNTTRQLIERLPINKNTNKIYNSLPLINNSEVTIRVNSLIIPEIEIECGICLGNIENKYEIPKCLHYYCKDCFKEYLKEKVKSSNSTEICCPKENCKQVIEKEILKTFLDSEDLKKIDKFEKRRTIINTQNALFCPWPDCESYAIRSLYKEKEKEILKCLDNNHDFCSSCLNKAEENHRCVKINSMENWENKEKQDVKKCPKCGFLIQKSDGCNHMKCINSCCMYEFCWICLGKYDPDHFNRPTTTCFGLGNISSRSILARSNLLRVLKCIFVPIMTFLITLILPIFSSFFLIGFVFQFMEIKSIMNMNNRFKRYLISTLIVCSIVFLGSIYLLCCIFLIILLVIVGTPIIISSYIFGHLMEKGFKRKIENNKSKQEELLNNPEIQENRNQAFELKRIEKRNNIQKILNDNINYRIDRLNYQSKLNQPEYQKIEIID